MLAISRGLMMDPDIVMLDEPSLGLAPIIVEDIFELILKIRDMGKTILLIEQNASMALSIADRGYVLETGKIIMEGKGKELLVDPRVKAAYLQQLSDTRMLRLIPYSLKTPLLQRAFSPARNACSFSFQYEASFF